VQIEYEMLNAGVRRYYVFIALVLIMTLSCRPIKSLLVLLVALQLCLPVSVAIYFSEYLDMSIAGHSGHVCAHTDGHHGHDSQDEPGQIAHCHELDAPYDTVSTPELKHSPATAALTSMYRGALLPGYGSPLDIPPKNNV
jgi:hypothetical protein